jgi:hypothetical protein
MIHTLKIPHQCPMMKKKVVTLDPRHGRRALLAALAREQGSLLEVMLSPEVITTRGTLSAITQQALAQGR